MLPVIVSMKVAGVLLEKVVIKNQELLDLQVLEEQMYSLISAKYLLTLLYSSMIHAIALVLVGI
jgi:hypothetical protein